IRVYRGREWPWLLAPENSVGASAFHKVSPEAQRLLSSRSSTERRPEIISGGTSGFRLTGRGRHDGMAIPQFPFTPIACFPVKVYSRTTNPSNTKPHPYVELSPTRPSRKSPLRISTGLES